VSNSNFYDLNKSLLGAAYQGITVRHQSQSDQFLPELKTNYNNFNNDARELAVVL